MPPGSAPFHPASGEGLNCSRNIVVLAFEQLIPRGPGGAVERGHLRSPELPRPAVAGARSKTKSVARTKEAAVAQRATARDRSEKARVTRNMGRATIDFAYGLSGRSSIPSPPPCKLFDGPSRRRVRMAIRPARCGCASNRATSARAAESSARQRKSSSRTAPSRPRSLRLLLEGRSRRRRARLRVAPAAFAAASATVVPVPSMTKVLIMSRLPKRNRAAHLRDAVTSSRLSHAMPRRHALARGPETQRVRHRG